LAAALGKYLRYYHLGFQFLLCIGLPTFGGIWLDRKYGTKAVWTIVGLAVGFATGLYSLCSELFRQDKKKDSDSGDDGPEK
jgi:F0F1-type ATP synthase assembly protein I